MRKLKVTELDRPDVSTYEKLKKMPVVVVMDNIRSMYNVGSVFRTSDAFLIEKIYLCGITARPPHKEIRKTALGADESVEWEYVEDAVVLSEKLREQGYELIAIEQVDKSIPLQDFEPNADKKYALILGNEVKGVQQKVIDQCQISLEIPQSGTKHSLNVSVCAGIVLWKFYANFTL